MCVFIGDFWRNVDILDYFVKKISGHFSSMPHYLFDPLKTGKSGKSECPMTIREARTLSIPVSINDDKFVVVILDFCYFLHFSTPQCEVLIGRHWTAGDKNIRCVFDIRFWEQKSLRFLRIVNKIKSLCQFRTPLHIAMEKYEAKFFLFLLHCKYESIIFVFPSIYLIHLIRGDKELHDSIWSSPALINQFSTRIASIVGLRLGSGVLSLLVEFGLYFCMHT